ncbi:MAG TPA: hypothetical protein DCY27_06400 [Desulfobacterales bacterium]|nr:hypothetical protein [Desulfobacterales bacterium]
MRLVKVVLVLLVLFIGFLLVRQNHDVLTQTAQFKLNLYIISFQSAPHSLWVLLTFALFLGIFGTGLYTLLGLLKQRQANRQLRHDLEVLKSEIQTIKLKTESTPPISQAADLSQSI